MALTLPFVILDKEAGPLDGKARSQAPGRFATLSCGTVHYELDGPEDAPAVVLVHGFSVPSYIWDPTFEALVDAGFRVLRFDLYGRGYSDRPKVDHTLDLFVEQLDEIVEKLGIPAPFHLVGLSMGGPVTAAYTRRHPRRIGSLTLVDPMTERLSFAQIFPVVVPLLGEYAMGVYVVPFLLPGRQQDDLLNPDRFPEWTARYEVQMRYTGYRRAIMSTLRHFMREVNPLSEYAAAGKTGVPILLFRGESDLTVRARHISAVRRAIPKAEFHEIPESAHIPHYERPEVVNPLLLRFLRSSEEQRPKRKEVGDDRRKVSRREG